jgi:hypothetical protein
MGTREDARRDLLDHHRGTKDGMPGQQGPSSSRKRPGRHDGTLIVNRSQWRAAGPRPTATVSGEHAEEVRDPRAPSATSSWSGAVARRSAVSPPVGRSWLGANRGKRPQRSGVSSRGGRPSGRGRDRFRGAGSHECNSVGVFVLQPGPSAARRVLLPTFVNGATTPVTAVQE